MFLHKPLQVQCKFNFFLKFLFAVHKTKDKNNIMTIIFFFAHIEKKFEMYFCDKRVQILHNVKLTI